MVKCLICGSEKTKLSRRQYCDFYVCECGAKNNASNYLKGKREDKTLRFLNYSSYTSHHSNHWIIHFAGATQTAKQSYNKCRIFNFCDQFNFNLIHIASNSKWFQIQKLNEYIDELASIGIAKHIDFDNAHISGFSNGGLMVCALNDVSDPLTVSLISPTMMPKFALKMKTHYILVINRKDRSFKTTNLALESALRNSQHSYDIINVPEGGHSYPKQLREKILQIYGNHNK